MNLIPKRSSLISLPTVLAGLMAMPLILGGSTEAQADVKVRVHGKVKVRVGKQANTRVRRRARVRDHRRVYRPYYRTRAPRVRLRIGGGVYWGAYYGRGFSQPPPPPSTHDCGPNVPVYYTTPPAPAPVVATAPAPLPPLPRFGIGAYMGTVDGKETPIGSDVGLLARLRLTERLSLEAELAKTEIEDAARVDRRLGGALLFDFAPRSRLSLNLLGGLGVTQVDMGDGAWESDQTYAEIGAGLTFRLTPKLHLIGDLRAGARTAIDGGPSDTTFLSVAAPPDEENFTRARLSAVLYF